MSWWFAITISAHSFLYEWKLLLPAEIKKKKKWVKSSRNIWLMAWHSFGIQLGSQILECLISNHFPAGFIFLLETQAWGLLLVWSHAYQRKAGLRFVFPQYRIISSVFKIQKTGRESIKKDGMGVFVETERTPEIKDPFEMVTSFYLDYPSEQDKTRVCVGYYLISVKNIW